MTTENNSDPRSAFDAAVRGKVLSSYTPQELVDLARAYQFKDVHGFLRADMPRALYEEILSRLLPAPLPASRERVDGKFCGRIYKNKNGEEIPPDEYVVFLAKDNAFPDTLAFYRKRCEELGADSAQLKAVDDAIVRLRNWRHNNPDRLKVPDVEPGEIRTR